MIIKVSDSGFAFLMKVTGMESTADGEETVIRSHATVAVGNLDLGNKPKRQERQKCLRTGKLWHAPRIGRIIPDSQLSQINFRNSLEF